MLDNHPKLPSYSFELLPRHNRVLLIVSKDEVPIGQLEFPEESEARKCLEILKKLNE